MLVPWCPYPLHSLCRPPGGRSPRCSCTRTALHPCRTHTRWSLPFHRTWSTYLQNRCDEQERVKVGSRTGRREVGEAACIWRPAGCTTGSRLAGVSADTCHRASANHERLHAAELGDPCAMHGAKVKYCRLYIDQKGLAQTASSYGAPCNSCRCGRQCRVHSCVRLGAGGQRPKGALHVQYRQAKSQLQHTNLPSFLVARSDELKACTTGDVLLPLCLPSQLLPSLLVTRPSMQLHWHLFNL